MTFSRKTRELVIVAALLVLPLLVLRATLRSPADLGALDRLVLRLVAPLQSAVVWCGHGLARGWRRYVYLVDIERKNESLSRENARLQGEVARLHLGARRLDELEKLAELRQSMPSETLAAHVVGLETSAFFRVMRIRLDRGESEVRAGMAVITPAGVVGRIERTVGPYCDVLLAIDAKSSIDVVVARTGGRGVMKGASSDGGYRMRLEYLLREDEVAAGDVVVTSGIGGAFPRDLPVGTVKRVKRADAGLYQEVEIVPAVDFGKLDEVLVLLAPPPAPDKEAGKRGEPVRGVVVPR